MQSFQRPLIVTLFVFATVPLCSDNAFAQTDAQCETRFLEAETVMEKRPVTVTKYVDETVMETKKRTSWKPLYQTEKLERRTKVLKPVQKTYEREERRTVLKPITETKYREREIEETTYEDVTEMREERRVVPKTIVETEMREQRIPVRKRIVETMNRTENVVQYKPVTTTQTQLVPGATATVATGLDSFRPQLQFLRRGQYIDPQTGLATFRRAGVHWVQPPATAQVPVLVPQSVQATTLVPEVVQRSAPVEVIRYEDSYETRKVPVTVEKTIDQVEVRKVPVTTRRPKTVKRVERIPYQETRYEEQVETRRVPVTETTYQEVEQVEPFERETCRWVQHTEEVKVPKTVRKRVEETTYRSVPKTVWKEVVIDSQGRRTEIRPASPLTESAQDSKPRVETSERREDDSPIRSKPPKKSVLESLGANQQSSTSTTTPSYNFAPTPPAATLLETSERQPQAVRESTGASPTRQRIDYDDRPIVRRRSSLYQPTAPATIEVPETKPDIDRPRTKLARIEPQADASQLEASNWSAPAATLPSKK